MRGNLSVLAAFVRRDFSTARSYALPFALEMAQALVTLVLFFYLGTLVDGSRVSGGLGLQTSYFDFALIGLALFEIVQVTLVSFALKLRRDQETGTIEALLVTPARQTLVVIGGAAYDMVRATLLGALMLVLGVVLFGFRPTLSGPDAVLALAAAAPATMVFFAAVGISLAAFTIVFKETTAMVSFVAVGLALFGGVYYPVDVLPAGLDSLAQALPFTWAVDVFRAALLGGDIPAGRLFLLIGAALAAIPVAVALLHAALVHAKRTGTLAQY